LLRFRTEATAGIRWIIKHQNPGSKAERKSEFPIDGNSKCLDCGNGLDGCTFVGDARQFLHEPPSGVPVMTPTTRLNTSDFNMLASNYVSTGSAPMSASSSPPDSVQSTIGLPPSSGFASLLEGQSPISNPLITRFPELI
jgi:hypothetical protein